MTVRDADLAQARTAGVMKDTLMPTDEAMLAEAIRASNGPLRIGGGRTKAGWGNPTTGHPLSTAGFSGVRLYEPGALTLVAGAGTPLSDVRDRLAAEGQILPFEPPDLAAVLGQSGRATIGGTVAVNASGPRRVRAGACRDALIGVRFVTGAGDVVKNGGRVMKNVTGYDLVKLMAGSFGTLGVLTEVSFKLLPAPETTATLSVHGLSAPQAVALMAQALSTPYEVTGAAHLHGDGAGVTHLRLEGLASSVAYRAEALRKSLKTSAEGSIALDAGPDPWPAIRDLTAFAGTHGDLWRVALRPSAAPAAMAELAPKRALLDHGGATLWVLMAEGTDLRARLSGIEGHATLLRASDETRQRLGAFAPDPPAVAALAQGLRAKFDPRGILNPGLMG